MRLWAALLPLLVGFPVFSQVRITEFMADNQTYRTDNFGLYEDWIEIYNTSATNVNLLNWALTDNSGSLFKWRFPSTNLPPKGYLVVYASNRDLRVPGQPLHTNFRLDPSGEYLALVRPDGSIASEFDFPGQIPDISFGLPADLGLWKLVSTGAVGQVKVPADSSLGLTWIQEGFNSSSWTRATNGIGFEAAGGEFGTDFVGSMAGDMPVGWWRLNETSTAGGAANLGFLAGAGNGQILSGVTVGIAGPRPSAFPGFESSNRAFNFNGGGKIDVPYNSALNPNGPFTVECWVRPANNSGTQCPVSSTDYTAGRSGYQIYQEGSYWDFRVGGTATYIAQAQGGVVQPGVWTHLVGVFDGSTARLYVNGALMAAVGRNGTFAPNTRALFRIGANANGNGQYFYNGDIDEVAFFDKALSAAAVQRRYEIAVSSTRNYAELIQSDLLSAMHQQNSSVYFRVPFVVTNPVDISVLTLRVKHDDGFSGWVNGNLVASENAPSPLSWNSVAPARRSLADALQYTEFDLSGAIGTLHPGTNIAAFQGLNYGATNGDFLLVAELEARSIGDYTDEPRYFMQPTPGELNGTGTRDLGPILNVAGHTPNVPTTNQSLTVTCRVVEAFAPISSVTLNWRVMYNTPTQAPMFDDGLHGDGTAGDGIYGAIISNRIGSAWTYTAGQMVRYYVTATDTSARTSRWPLFENPTESAEYLGTVVQPDYVQSKLPVVHLFVQNYANGVGVDNPNKVGGRATVFHDGELYDNVFMCVRGNTTAGYFKKSHRFVFNRDHQFRHPGPGKRLRKTSFTADYPDPTYMRQGLSFWLAELVGAPGPFYYPMRLQMNGSFYQLANHNDVHGEELLDRLGYDSNGALYNAVGTVEPGGFSTGGFDKKTRTWEGNTDYVAMANAISASLPAGTRRTNIFDILDLPNVINYMVVARFAHENDDVWANMSMYRDSDGDGLWRIIPFDMNLSWGAIFAEGDASLYNGIQSTNDSHKAHPLYGSSQALAATSGAWNRMYDVIFTTPATREMFLRRLRTMLDTWIKPPGTPANELVVEPYILAWRDLIAEEAATDRAIWGWPGKGGQSNFDPGIDLATGVTGMINEFVVKRRAHFYGKHSVTNTALPIGITKSSNAGVPLAQPADAIVSIHSWDYNPTSGNQDEEYLCLTNANNFAVDISGWRLGGGVTHQMQPGTVIPSYSSLYLTPNAAAFRARTTGPRKGMGLFVQGNYSGRLSAWGESLTLKDPAGRLVSSNSFVGTPSLAQQYLRVTEIMYNPSPLAGSQLDPQAFEYVELKNTSVSATLNLTGVRFTNGIYFNFTGSAVTSLAPGQSVLVVRDAAAFAIRYGAGFNVAGQYTGSLDNGGETIRLEDAVGEKILEFAYNDAWYPVTDGLGFSLVITDPLAHWSLWDRKASWRASGAAGGSPGTLDPAPANLSPVLVTEALAHTDPPLVDTIELYNPTGTNAAVGGWWLTDDPATPQKYRIPDGTTLGPGGYVTFKANESFGVGPNAFLLSEYGEMVCLFSADSGGNLTGYSHDVDFGAAPSGYSFGRFTTSLGETHFVLQSANTLGTNNALPKVGPLVISEVMYHPPDSAMGVDISADEFIEIQNIQGTTVPLYCIYTNEAGYGKAALTNTWRLRNGVDFDFPTNVAMAANSRLLVVGFDPQTNAAQVTRFRSLYSVPGSVAIYGPWSGKLDNSGETIELKGPDRPDVTPTNIIVPYVMVDKLDYADTTPWPAEADGTGWTLQRVDIAYYGNDPVNWTAGPPTAGQLASQAPRIVAPPQSQSVISGGSATFTVLAIGTAPLSYQWRLNGGNIAGATRSSLTLSPVTPSQQGEYSVLVSNTAGSANGAANLSVSSIRPTITDISANGSSVVVTAAASAGTTCTLEFRENLDPGPWSPVIPSVVSTGGPVFLTDTNAPPSQRFYRVRGQ